MSAANLYAALGTVRTCYCSPASCRLAAMGVTLSERQVEAFLHPALAAGEGRVDYPTFVSLARPRAYVDPRISHGLTSPGAHGGVLLSPAPVGQGRRASVDAGSRPLLGHAREEGYGRYGAVAPEAGADSISINAADFVRKTNTGTHGVSWDALANKSAGVVTGEETGTEAGAAAGVYAAVEEEWAGMSLAGRAAAANERRGRVPEQEVRSSAADHVSVAVHGYTYTDDGSRDAEPVPAAPEGDVAPVRDNPVLTAIPADVLTSTSRAASAWRAWDDGSAASSSRAAGMRTEERVRSRSAAPSSRRAAAHSSNTRVSERSAGVQSALTWSAHVGSAGVLEPGSARNVVVADAVAGVPTDKQPLTIAGAHAIMAEEAAGTRVKPLEHHDRTLRSSDVFVRGAAGRGYAYPHADPIALAEMRNKVRARLAPPSALDALKASMREEAVPEEGSSRRGSMQSEAARRGSRASVSTHTSSVGALMDWTAGANSSRAASPAGVSSPRQIHHVLEATVFTGPHMQAGSRSERKHYEGRRAFLQDSTAFAGLGPAE